MLRPKLEYANGHQETRKNAKNSHKDVARNKRLPYEDKLKERELCTYQL